MVSQKNIDQVKEISDQLKTVKAVYLINHTGLGGNDLTELRSNIRESGGQMVVTKNTLLLNALRNLPDDHPCAIDTRTFELKGTTATLYAYEDEIKPIKTIVKYAKEKQLPEIKYGLVSQRVLSADEVANLAKLPGHTQMRAQVLGMLQSPISGFVQVLNGNLQKLVVALSEIRKQNETKIN